MMKPLEDLEFHPTAEKLVKVLCAKTQNPSPQFFRILVAYYLAKIASMQRCKIKTHTHGVIPVNVYAMNLATSGQGKGHSTNIMEEEVINQFKERFLDDTFRNVADISLNQLAVSRSAKKGTNPDEEIVGIEKEFYELGALAFSFDSGTTAAVKQMRHKLLMANAGSMNMEIDEIGSNLLGQQEVLNTFLELYDVGKVKQKLTKNTNDNRRNEEIDGRTPTNCMLFGTPDKLFDGGKIEEELLSMFDTGYGRRCIFGFSDDVTEKVAQTPQEIYDELTDTSKDAYIQQISDYFGQLADQNNFNTTLLMDKPVNLLLIEYRQLCEQRANEMGRHESIKKAEMSHRYFKALKIAGSYAFVDCTPDVTETQLYNAICLVEESGKAFSKMLTRDRTYVKLAKYIAEVGREVTHVDLVEDLPFYKTGRPGQDLMALATAWGYKNNVIIKRSFDNGIEFLKGESLKATDLENVNVSYSTHEAYQYQNVSVPYEDLHLMTQAPGIHWISHHVKDREGTAPADRGTNGHRNEDNCIPGFNLIVLDVDEGCSLETAKMLMKGYKCMFYTTKRHQTKGHGDRFRVIFPMNYTLHMDRAEYREFCNNIYEWVPFGVDLGCNQRSKKWESNDGHFEYMDGELIDVLPFIPKTTKNEERKKIIYDQQSLSNLERWFVNNTGTGNRSNQMIRYALALVDSGLDQENIRTKVLGLNSKLQDKMPESEVLSTVMVTVGKTIAQRLSEK